MPGYNNGGYGGGGNRYSSRQGGYPPRNSGPSRQNAQREQQESTSGVILVNERAGKFLDFNYWGRYVSLDIGAVPPGAAVDWMTKRNAQKTSQLMSYADMVDLESVCLEVLDTVKTTGTFTSAGISAGTRHDAIVEISNGSNIQMNPGIYLVIYKNLDPNRRTNALEFYPFVETHVIRGYDHSSGSSKDDISKLGDFKRFVKLVSNAVDALSLAQAHAVRVGGKPDRLTTFRTLGAIAVSMGVNAPAEVQSAMSSQNRGGSAPRGNSGQNYAPRQQSYGNSQPAPQPQMNHQNQILAQMDDPVDINLSMNDLASVDMSKFT